MTSVHRVIAEIDRFASIGTADRDEFLRNCPFDGTRLPPDHFLGTAAAKQPPEFFVENPSRPHPDIWGICGLVHALAVTREAFDKLGVIPDEVGEWFKVSCEGRQLVVLNVTYCINVLNVKESQFDPNDNQRITKYEFHGNRLDYSLMKIPQTRKSELLTFEGLAARCDEFKHIVEDEGLTGVQFKRLWSR